MDKIIDAHAHLGDVLVPGGKQVIRQTGVKKKLFMDANTTSEWLLHRDFLLGDFMARQAWRGIAQSDMARSRTGTLENMLQTMKATGITQAVCLPIAPFCTFQDMRKEAGDRPELIYFTSPDFQQEDFAGQLDRDFEQGARGMKLHPIIQERPLTDPKTYQAVETAQKHDVPILFHCGRHAYYPDKDLDQQKPELGTVPYAEKMVADFPKVRFIAGHSGLFGVKDVMDRLSRFPNVWVDTSFQPPERIRQLIKAFGTEKVLFGSDWPFGNRPPALKIMRIACKKDPGLLPPILHENAAQLFHVQD